ncbi:MAG: NADH-quinone oxidoreductase subunit NuoE [Oscillochloris sp.]|nr:NADH-quinone oxidoreductase subunit NuoE [Oscillochloris sp.]
MLLDTHKSEIETIVGRYASKRSAVLPLLYIAQDTYGHLTTEAIREVATILDLPYTDVHEVVGFYTLFYNRPMGTWVLQVCDDVPCCYLGAEELITALKDTLGIAEEQTTSDGLFTLQRVKCLAACHRAPVLQANLDYVYDVTPERVGALLANLRSRVAEAQQHGVSGRFAEDYAFGSAGKLVHLERPASSQVAPEPPAPVVEAVTATEASAQVEAQAESPTQPAPDRSPAGEMPKPETVASGMAIPAHPAQQDPPA